MPVLKTLSHRQAIALVNRRAASAPPAPTPSAPPPMDRPAVWKPFPDSPQEQAFYSQADETFYGGAAGGGKTDLGIGLGLTAHRRTLFLRREASQLSGAVHRIKEVCGPDGWRGQGEGGTMRHDGRTIRFAGCKDEDDKLKYQGDPYDLYVIDETPHFSRAQVRYVTGWNRSSDPRQRCRVLLTGNPPTTPEGRWIIEEFAPWLDPTFADPARPGELRWYYVDEEGKTRWLKTPETVTIKGQPMRPRSRTFFPADLKDNPVYMQTGDYLRVLQSLPEPLRSQMLYGDFTAGMEDDPWQVIPTAWVRAAMARWVEGDGLSIALSALGVDVARGGKAQTVLVKRRKNWLAPLLKFRGKDTPDGAEVLAHIKLALAEETHIHHAPILIDAIGVGASPFDLGRAAGLPMVPVVFSNSSAAKDRSGALDMANVRAWAWWSMREQLDPDRGDNLALPPDPELLADLCAPRFEVRAHGILIEAKEDIEERIGRSPDCGDAVVLACFPMSTDTISGKATGRPERPRQTQHDRRRAFGR